VKREWDENGGWMEKLRKEGDEGDEGDLLSH
jgi:hypothetical protein